MIGVGVTLLGPAIFRTLTGTWFLTDWLVLEGGFFADRGFELFGGLRLRPGAPSADRMWFGASVAGGCHEHAPDADTDNPPPRCQQAAVLRTGVDVVRWRNIQFSPEFDLRIPTDSQSEPRPRPGAGFTASYLF